MKNNELKKFAQMLSEELKKPKEVQPKEIQVESTSPVEVSSIDMVSQYLSKKRVVSETAIITETNNNIEEAVTNPANIEKQRWADPLKSTDTKFVTFKEMNDHYGLFLQRIQQQMSSIGGGGEVKFARLDDVSSATVGLNKYLTYNQATKKFYFNTIGTGEGIYLNTDNEVTLNVASPTVLGGVKIGDAFEINGSDLLQLRVATNTELGGVKLGPGVTVNNQDQIIIDSSGLDFNFGDFVATVPPNGAATLSSVNMGQDIDIVSSANGIINVVGNFHVHTTDTYDPNNPDVDGAIFRVDQAGKVRMLVPDANQIEGAITIIGTTSGLFQAPVNTGVMLHITGQLGTPGIPSRIYNDAQNAFAAFVARRYNGTASAPTAVLADEELMRISGTAHNGTIIPGTGNQRIVYRALGNQTLSNQGGSIELWTTPLNSSTITKIATIDAADGITATKFTGPLTGNADTVTNGVYTTGDQTIGGTKTFSSTISGSINGTANVATTVTLVATNSTAATHYLTFVDSATGNENVRTDTDLTYNPGNGTFSATKLNGKYVRNYRDAGVVADGGTVTIDFSTDNVVLVSWDNGFTLAYQNYEPGSVITLIAYKRTGTGTDSFSLDGLTPGHVSTGSTTISSTADVSTFVEFICTGTTIGSVYAKV